MSLSADVPTKFGLRYKSHTSEEPKCSTIFGHVLLAVQRSRMPAAGSPRTGSGQAVHQRGPSPPAWYKFSAPSGIAKRAFNVPRRPAMIGQAPSYTFLLFSSRVNPSCLNARRKLPDFGRPLLIT